jgi:hypothetical protein
MIRDETFWSRLQGGRIPLVLKLAYTAFLCVLLPYYWINYGPQNFLWFCDVALFLTLAALWLENRFLTSMALVGILLPQLAWLVDFFVKLVGGWEYDEQSAGIAGYMFKDYSLFLRGLSTFHGWLPLLLLYLLWKLGYHRRAWIAQTLLVWAILPASYFFSEPGPAPPDNQLWATNVNWVHGGFGIDPELWPHPALYLLTTMAIFPLCLHLPTHFLLLWLLPPSKIHPPQASSSEASLRTSGVPDELLTRSGSASPPEHE